MLVMIRCAPYVTEVGDRCKVISRTFSWEVRLFLELRITMAEAVMRAAEGKSRDILMRHITSNTPVIWSLTLAPQ